MRDDPFWRYPIGVVGGVPVQGPPTIERRPAPEQKSTLVIFRHASRDPACKRVVRRTYFVDERRDTIARGKIRTLWRPDPVRGSRAPYEDLVCPECPGSLQWDEIDGRVVDDHPCDARCMGARGPTCECSCGGANHGCAFQVSGDFM